MEKLEHLLLTATLRQLKDAEPKKVTKGTPDSSSDLSPLSLLETLGENLQDFG